jgi:xylulokinase
MAAYLLGVDIGTHATKCVLVTRQGHVVAHDTLEHGVSRPLPGWAEHDAEEVWWSDFTRVVSKVLSESKVNPTEVAAIGVSALAPALVPLDDAGQPLRPAILYGIDTRASAEIAWFNAELGLDRPGTPPARRMQTQSLAPKIVWIRLHEPECWSRTRKILGPTGYVVHRLSGAYVIDSANAEALDPFFDSTTRAWNPEMCDRFGVPLELLPRIHEATDVVGRVTAEAARQTGLAVGTPVICGTMDALAEYLSAGVTKADEACVIFGSTMCVCVLTDEPRFHPLLSSGRSLVPGMSRLSGGMATSGAALRWFRDNFSRDQPFSVLDEEAAGVPAGSEGLVVLPYFSGERTPLHDSQARGLILGLTLSHTRGHVYRALLEGMAYGLAHHFELMADVGVVARRVVGTGGGSRSELWTQIVSDVMCCTLECVEQPYGAALADAFLAGRGIGLFDSFSELSDHWVHAGRNTVPDPETSSVYQRYYHVYRNLYERTRDDMHELACLGATTPIRR